MAPIQQYSSQASPALIWKVIKPRNAFTRTSGEAKVTFTCEKGNICGVHKEKYSGLLGNSAGCIVKGGRALMCRTNPENPRKMQFKRIGTNPKVDYDKIAKFVGETRPDLAFVAVKKLRKIQAASF